MTDQEFTCPYCGRPVSRPEDGAEETLCPGCQIPVPVPEPPAGGPPPSASVHEPTFTPSPSFSGPPPPRMIAGSQAEGSGLTAKLRMVGMFNCAMGSLSFIMVLFYSVYVVMVLVNPSAIIELMRQNGQELPTSVFALVYGGLALLSLLSAVVQMAAGIRLIKSAPSARNYGLASGIISVMSLWLCCTFPLSIACGIFTLMALMNAPSHPLDMRDE